MARSMVASISANAGDAFGGMAVSGALRQPGSIVLDADGNVYIADTGNNRIRRVDAKSGFITTYAGGGTPPEGQIGDGGPATGAIIGRPFGLAIFGGSLYITEQDYNANRVRRVDMATGSISTVAGATDSSVLGGFGGDGGLAKDARLDTPLGIAADAAGNLYFADLGNKRVRRIDPSGIITTYAGGGVSGTFTDGIPATAADLDLPTVVAFDRDGNLLIGVTPGIRKVDKSSHLISTVLNPAGLIYGMAVDGHGKIYFPDATYGKVFTFTPGDAMAVTFAG